MNVIEAIHARRAVRAYSERRIDERTLRTLLDAAVWAPSAMNEQPWAFAVVQDRRQLQRYSDRAKELLRAQLETPRADAKAAHYRELLSSDSFNIFYDATTLVTIGVQASGPYREADCWLAAENMMLAALELGIGSCCIGFAIPLLNTTPIKRELGFPADGAIVAPIIFGYPSAAAPSIPRQAPRLMSWSTDRL